MKKTALPLLVIVLAGVALAWLAFNRETEPGSAGVAESRSTTPQGGDFVLQSQQGPVSLKDLRGRVVLLYFGYTWCPDICPTSLTFMSQALARLEEEELQQVQGIFVSVDPERDTLERLDTYSNYFHANIVGVTGTAEEVAKVSKLYGAAYRKAEIESATGYVVDHTSVTYVIDQQGQLHATLPHGATPSRIIEEVRSLLHPKGQ